MDDKIKLDPNSLTFIALSNEYCQAIENAPSMERDDFVINMLKLLPRLYMVASDMRHQSLLGEYEIESYLTEDIYNHVRELLAQTMGEEDIYLEVFVDDMKYSDTPIACSISENLTDLYQEFYNFISTIKDASTKSQMELLGQCKAEFQEFWGQTLCNVLRALHNAYYSVSSNNDF